MKKSSVILLAVVMAVTVLVSCGSNPVLDDLSNFINVEMAEINADYVKITEEVANWASLTEDTEFAASISEVLLPLVNGSLTKLEVVNPATEEVQALKAKYAEVMESYKLGFEALVEACNTQDEAAMTVGNEYLDKGIQLLDEYNAGLEALATQVGAEVSY